ncbi:MAC/perforin domain-containing protein [Chitinophaga flava]|uniref:MACPF domain-containing protein n=1 Tax=Chitinophaga flava TaxID=2259036 RepID=A0A365XXD9_9BACT|nr:MAC/perforin domain-containing protein [Chitinophaga flava]RBL90245.1 hypothetical protein DF182_27660 [Chitinophaga flava]
MKSVTRTSQTLLLLAGLTTFSFYSCKKNDLSQTSPQSSTMPRSAGDGKNDLLGYGYDVTGEYANSSASRFKVINVEQLQLDQPTRIEWDQSKRQVGNLVAGENAKSFLEKKSLKVKGSAGIGVFKATITTSFSSSDAFSSTYVYSGFDLIIQQKRVKMNASIALLKQYLTPNFVADIQNETPQYIVKTYGTHVLGDITLGAKLQVLYRSQTSSSDKMKASEAGIDVSVGKVFSINTGFSHTEQETQSNSSQSLHYQTIGGDPSKKLIGQIPIGQTVPKVSITDWQASSTVANAEMIDFNTESLVPLYDLVSDPVKQAALKAYIDQYLKDRQVVLVELPNKIYAKISYENPGMSTSDDYSWTSYFYDYYIRFYKADKVTPVTVNNLTVNYRINTSSSDDPRLNQTGATKTYQVTNSNYISLGRDVYQNTDRYDSYSITTFKKLEVLPGNGYEPMPE